MFSDRANDSREDRILRLESVKFRRVQERRLEYKSITDPRISEQGPSGTPFLGAKRLDLGGGASDKK